MTFLSLLAALLLEQGSPLRRVNVVHSGFDRYALFLEGELNGGGYRDGVIAWMLVVLPTVATAAAIFFVLDEVNPLAGLAWSVAVLHFTMGFRQFSHSFTEVQNALRDGALARARERLGEWCGSSAAEFNAGEIARVAIEQGLLDSHRHVFGTVFWFAALGPAGAVLYRASAMLANAWGTRSDPEYGAFGRFAARAFYWLDWLPARATALSFAIVGDFEDAIYCWRTQSGAWAVESHGILLASGGGALGVRLGAVVHQHGTLQFRPELGVGEEADTDFMQSAIGLIWRALVLWMFLILLVSLAHALG